MRKRSKARSRQKKAEQNKATEKQNQENLEKARKAYREAKGNENPEELKEAKVALEHAEEAVTQFARQQDIKRREKKMEEAKKGADETQKSEETNLEAQVKRYEETLDEQLVALTKALEKGEQEYKRYVENVNKILAGSGVALIPTPGEEKTIGAGPGPSAPTHPGANKAVNEAFPGGEAEHKKYVKEHSGYVSHASGGGTYRGVEYLVGETGPELFTPSQNGHITPASRTPGGVGGIHFHNPTFNMVDRNAPERFAHRLGHKLVHGGHA